MPQIIVSEHAGACFGVERALACVEAVLAQASSPVHTLGPLIHNPSVVDSLAARGVQVIKEETLGNLPKGDTLVLRTHGVVPDVVASAKAAGLEVIDATCPYVKKVHVAAERLTDQDYQVLVVGEAGHPEVEGILGHAPAAHVVLEPADLEGLDLGSKIGIVVQTTQAKARVDALMQALEAPGREVKLINTICEATSERQEAARTLSKTVDVMVVIGGKNSANTTRLAEICAAHTQTYHIETASELDPAWFEGAATIGITAGASTPEAQIKEIQATLFALTTSDEKPTHLKVDA